MKKCLLIVALLVTLGIAGTMFVGYASAQCCRIPMATAVVGAPGWCGPVAYGRCIPACVPVCVPSCVPRYTCAVPAKKAAKTKDAKPKAEKKVKKDKK